MAAIDDPVWGPKVARMSARRADLVLRSARMPDAVTIPPRQWLYGTQLLRGFVSVLVAPGGTGKSAYAMVVAAELASGMKLLGEHVHQRVNVAVLNLEDPMDELDRRLAAIMIRHGIDEYELRDRLFLHSGEDRPVTMSAISDDGFQVVHPDEEVLIAEIRRNNIGMICVDPFAESHTLEENSNPHMVAAAAAWRRVARATNCGAFLIHHVRKGAVTDIDSARGAKGLTDSARVGMLLSPMSVEESEQFGIPSDRRSRYVRLDNAKANLAPKAGAAKWFELDQVSLNNGTQDYPFGDTVAAIVRWEPPNPLAQQSSADLNRALDAIAAGPGPGTLYSATKRGGSERWAGAALQQVCGMNERQAAPVIAAWVKEGLLSEVEYHDPNARRTMRGVRVVDSKRPGP